MEAKRMLLIDDEVDALIRSILAERRGTAPAGTGAVGKAAGKSACEASFQVSVGVSNRHIHLSRMDMDALFGPGSELHRKKAMKQPGQYAAEETVTLRGPKGELKRVRVLGPLRRETQAEVSVTDGFAIGVSPPLRMSGDLAETPGIEIVGPCGTVRADRGLIVARRHIHMLPDLAARLGLANGEEVEVAFGGPRAGVMAGVVVRVAEASFTEMHVDVDEANAFCLKNGDLGTIARR